MLKAPLFDGSAGLHILVLMLLVVQNNEKRYAETSHHL